VVGAVIVAPAFEEFRVSRPFADDHSSADAKRWLAVIVASILFALVHEQLVHSHTDFRAVAGVWLHV